ncbi:carboxypeptidase-like regulatory domain-containing protein [uncultured Pontibacter sp.]|uniref:carboxypeptidase-like regulatory domain-containing protein n=1 Tax=uncultured Pontibacter sp. TaxID=453356 RepID=UPI00260593FD|nr:carboxypeptidase-like regulatory domain-containing protein [uncultured Pontibacter sp.]
MLKATTTLRLFCALFFLIVFTACNEDTIEPLGEGSIGGEIRDADTSEPLAGVAVTSNPATSAIASDEDGRFVFEPVAGGNYTLLARKSGYKTESVAVAVKNDNRTFVTILMVPENPATFAPGPPSLVDPSDNAPNQNISLTLKWTSPEARSGDSLTYNVYLYESGVAEKKLLVQNITDTTTVASNLKFNTTYFWQVTVKNKRGAVTNGPVWSFTTHAMPVTRFVFAREEEGNYDIYSSDGTAANVFRLTSSFSREWWPVISPIRDRIAYSSNVGTDIHIYTMNRDGSEKRQLTTIPVAGYHNQGIGFTWSPDGGQLLYAHYDNLYLINRNGTGLRLIAKAPANRHFRMIDWTASGNKIVVQTIGSNINDSEIYIMDSDGGNMTLLVENLPGRIESPTFSVNGRNVMYTRDVEGFENAAGRQLNAQIFIKNLETSRVTNLSNGKPDGTNDLFPRFSSDGSKIVFTNAPNDGVGPSSVWMMDVSNGRNRVRLFENATMPDYK